MLNLGLIAFAQPALLGALLALPVLWWLLRVTPPAPRRQRFPAIRLLLGLQAGEETPHRTPWWLLLMRLLIAALVIIGLAQPLLNPSARAPGNGPLVLLVDDGWSAARNWDTRLTLLNDLLSQAEREERPVVLQTTAPTGFPEDSGPIFLQEAAEVRRGLDRLMPKPWPVQREAALESLRALDLPPGTRIVWLSDGLTQSSGGGDAAGDDGAFMNELARLGEVTLVRDGGGRLARLLLPPEDDGRALELSARRVDTAGADRAFVLAQDEDGRAVGRAELNFADGSDTASARLDLPAELRNRIARLAIEGEASAGAVQLLDERWRRRPVGLIDLRPGGSAQPLLSELYYLERALAPFTELRRGGVDELLQRELAVMVLTDADSPDAQTLQRLGNWVENGGLLLRFAGPRLVENSDELLPVRLRVGDRQLGGALTWDTPARLANFDAASPFAGLTVPGDVLVERQVLAEPALDLADKTWARLADGTPLVTAEKRGDGWVVLMHITANNDWSNLPISGLFVEMLRRVVAVSQGVTAADRTAQALPPLETLDGFGILGPPPSTVLALEGAALSDGLVDAEHPPGYYGREDSRQAHNLASAGTPLLVLPDPPGGIGTAFYSRSQEVDLKPWLLAAALLLGVIDLIIGLGLRGLLRPAATAGLAFMLLTAAAPGTGLAQSSSDDQRAVIATQQTHLAYVQTDVPDIDEVSRSGLDGLSRILLRRTSVEVGDPVGVDLERDELAFYPLLYWPITTQQRDLSEEAKRRVNAFLANGGTILFDLREAVSGLQLPGSGSRGTETLQRLTQGIDIPPLVQVPPDHVLTKAFYLLQDFPGRYTGGALWLEAADDQDNDGVASVLVGSNDWAGAWAVDQLGQPRFAVVPGGARQREMALRFGVNLVMYALTGNYKADQVHVPFILERLGQ